MTTIQDVKNCIVFEVGSIPYNALNGIVECTYKIALSKGKTEKEAVKEAADALGKQLIKMSKP